jgi:type II secretory ATPase GspE/PulE/Tfp pilus assembly ATPase PilB-like protein
LPTSWGESVVMRILDHAQSIVPGSRKLQFTDQFTAGFMRVLQMPRGGGILRRPDRFG